MSAAKLEAQLKALTARKEMLFTRIQNLYDASTRLKEPANLNTFKIRYISLENTCKDFKEVIEEINLVSLALDPDYIPDYAGAEALDTLYCHIQAAAAKVFNKQPTASTTAAENPVQSPVKARLPKLEIVGFAGDIKHWPVFYETFKALIHENRSLSDIEKVHFLVGKLSGSALSVCAGLPPVAANYQIIWQALVDKYQDTRSLAVTYLDKILNFKPLNVESASALNQFLEGFSEPVAALKQLEIPDLAGFILLCLALKKLDPETGKLFEMSLENQSDIPDVDDLLSFVKDQAKILMRTRTGNTALPAPKKSSSSRSSTVTKNTQSFVVQKSVESGDQTVSHSSNCVVCNSAEHTIYHCPAFLKLSPAERYKLVKDKSLCLNCLCARHRIASCKSKVTCGKCKSPHHTLLHFDRPQAAPSTATAVADTSASDESPLSHCSTVVPTLSLPVAADRAVASTVLLSTAVVHVLDHTGTPQHVRVLLDSASQSHFLTESCCKSLGLPRHKVQSSVRGIGLSSRPIQGTTSFTFLSRFDSNVKFSLNAFLIDRITDGLPTVSLQEEALSHLKGLPLADENFHVPGRIDGLIGAELFPYLIGSGKVTGPPSTPIALQSSLGFVVMGKTPAQIDHGNVQTFCAMVDPPLESLVERFWALEEVPVPAVLDREEEECETIFRDTYSRDPSGRYTVSLPFKLEPTQLGDSFFMAKRRFLSLEKRLESSSSTKLEYHAFMRDYLEQGHMSLVKNPDLTSTAYYLPHHCVLKPQSSSTKLRVVFDASAKSDSSYSLNDLLYTGPKLQSDIVVVLLNFRLHPVAMTADLKQMYRQILITPLHRRLQQILWRFSPSDTLDTFELNTVTFGVKPSPFLALRVVRQLVSDEQQRYPLAASVIVRDTYVDDVASSVVNENQAIELYHQLVALFESGGFALVKWSTNSSVLRDRIPSERRVSLAVDFEQDPTINILGLQWIPSDDTFTFKATTRANECTKRGILSTIARIFDPLGLLAPITLHAKLLIKELWKLQLDWDDNPPDHIRKVWDTFQTELPMLSTFSIPRHVSVFEDSKVELVGFADASEQGYGAVIYVRSKISTGEFRVTLLCAKSKVAPMKSVSLPRLELCAALLLANLMNVVLESYRARCSIDTVFAFSDSMVTLHWINSSPHRWKTFVANRVAKIQDKIDPEHWFHVASEENPADCLSRGLTPASLLKHPLWLVGPSWAARDESDWPLHSVATDQTVDTGEEKPIVLAVVVEEENPLRLLISRMSSYRKLVKVTAYVLRFAYRTPANSKTVSVHELEIAENLLLKVTQQHHFRDQLRALENDQSCFSALRKLHPFVHDGLIRVGGRLANASISFDQQHPVLLPKKDPLVNLIIDQCHRDNLHTGPHLVLALLRQRFWILSGRGIVRQRTQSCNRCFKTRPKPSFPLMGDLPACRVQQAKPFGHTGVDYAGPFNITISRRRGAKTQKAYICLFVCLSTKALHLELASDLSTTTFLAAFKRFLARRGPCSVMYSDNGTNFIGAKASLDALYDFVQSQDFASTVEEELTHRHIEWKLNPPSAPHFGGIWESNVKSVKTHLYKVMGTQILTYEEFTTLLTQVEALLNSRPLCVLSSDPSAPTALTPAHFLTLTPLHHLPASDVTSEPLNRLTRFELIDRMVQDYWKRWHLEYLSTRVVQKKTFF